MAKVKSTTPVPVRRGEAIELEITGLAHGGDGVGRHAGFTIFVPQAVPGDTLRVRITEVKKNYARGEAAAILTPSPERAEPLCPVYAECGGCQLQHINYPAQLAYKQKQVEDALRRIGGLKEVTVRPVIGMTEPWYYRNKAQAPVGAANGELIAGAYAKGTHRIVSLPECRIQHNLNNKVLTVARQVLTEYKIPAYDETSGEGIIRHLIARTAARTGAALLMLVTNGPSLPRGREIAAEIMARVPELVGVSQNINPERTNVILGRETKCLAGQGTLTDYIGPFAFAISPASFFQVNPVQTEVLYAKAVEYAGLTGQETVIDAYCGIGTISLFLAQRAKQVYGIEVVAAAIEDARENARRNGVENVEFIAGEVEAVLPQLYEQGVRPEVVVVDPPRAGCAESVLNVFAAMQPKRIVYVSCNPGSLARDLAILAGLGYETKEVQPVDMFPQTSHVESIVLMTNSGLKGK